ncbi:MAG: metallophosphoesterase, partial [Candidatus Desulfovibrio faecigallinarum]|nr:metallophosphoesterase [Candidatus Desulfovibrio faecigallinarum]
MDCYRSVFLSDLHLGSPWCRARNLLAFLENTSFEKLYLVGDVLDNWHLRRGHRLSKNQLLVWERLLEISWRKDVCYLVGNHDAFLDAGQPYYAVFRQAFAGMDVCRRAIHTAANGKKYLVEHGDAYDAALKSRTLTWAATLCYEVGR